MKKISISFGYILKGKKKYLTKQIFEPFNKVNLDEKQMIFNVKYINYYSKNLINYLDNEFNIFEYLGGLKPLIPFVSLINGIYEKNNIAEIGGIKKMNI